MEYELVEIVAQKNGAPYGYAVKKVAHQKLASLNVLAYEEAQAQVDDLNERAMLLKFWPMPTDPEVQELIADPHFDPVEYDEVDVPDLFRSNVVYDMKPGARIGTDDNGDPIFGPDEVKYDDAGEPIINWIASEIVYKKERQPKRTQGMGRIEAASRRVAQRRMEQANASA